MTPVRITAAVVSVGTLAVLAWLSVGDVPELPGKPLLHLAGFTIATIATLVIATSFARTQETVVATAAWVFIVMSLIAIALEVLQTTHFGGIVEKGDIAVNLAGSCLGRVGWWGLRKVKTPGRS